MHLSKLFNVLRVLRVCSITDLFSCSQVIGAHFNYVYINFLAIKKFDLILLMNNCVFLWAVRDLQ